MTINFVSVCVLRLLIVMGYLKSYNADSDVPLSKCILFVIADLPSKNVTVEILSGDAEE